MTQQGQPGLSQDEILRKLLQGEEGRQWASERSQGWFVNGTTQQQAKVENVCVWEGVECNSASQITSLVLPETDLLATLPTELALLTELTSIDLRQNLLRGTIPSELADMTSLVTLVLKDNRRVTGTLPVFHSPKLKYLDLSRMALHGQIPPDFGQHNTALTFLELRENQLTGFLPYGLEDLPHLATLSISGNQLSGTLPEYIGSMTSLVFLYLDNNRMVGTIPTLSRPMEEVWFQHNQLSGTIPSTIDTSVLRDLYLDGNKLTGTVPPTLCQDDLNADFFTTTNRDLCDSVTCRVGTVSDQGVFPCRNCTSAILNPYLGRVGECDDWTETAIVNMLLQQNQKSACDYTDMVTCNAQGHVVKIHAQGRQLTGTLPDELGLLQYLEELDVSNNNLEGFFPSGLRLAPLLRKLDISGNRLRGIVPPLVCKVADRINNGNGDCTAIACPVGTYSKDTTGYGECFPCPGGGGTYLASTSCTPESNTTSTTTTTTTTTMTTPLWELLLMAMLVSAAIVALVYYMNRSRQKDRTYRWDHGFRVDGKSISFPHAEESKTMLQRFRVQRSNKSRTGKQNWLQNRLSRSYHYAISLKETEAVHDPPGAKVIDMTGGEIDDFGWRERDSILLHRDLENVVEAQKNATKLEVWEYPDPLEKPRSYAGSFEESDHDDHDDDAFGDDEDDLSEWIKKQQNDPSTREVWLDVPHIT